MDKSKIAFLQMAFKAYPHSNRGYAPFLSTTKGKLMRALAYLSTFTVDKLMVLQNFTCHNVKKTVLWTTCGQLHSNPQNPLLHYFKKNV